ncbi:putative Thioesterase-like superfamily/Thioesterase superfamily [Leishmania naiffi]|uniref:Thioesterase-like superfamily/Thioesterase superfamily n=1 Tax=Leishmania naiffi TaxID=5678 RepID=A0AAW3BKQ9_9TRYP
MVLLHLLRCQRFLWRGLRDRARVSKMISGSLPIPSSCAEGSVVPVRVIRAAAARTAALQQAPRPPPPRFVWPWLRQLPFDRAFVQFIAQPMVVPMYCGLRMIDQYGHVNNSKYLELCELARWHQLSFLGIGTMMVQHRVTFVVSDLSITYQREIKPRSTVWVATRIVLPPSSTALATPSSSSSPPVEAPPSDKRRLYVEHEIWSKDGCKLHATSTVSAALIGSVEYEQELARRYDPTAKAAAAAAAGASVSTRPRQRATLNCEHALADAAGLSSVAELRKLFESVEYVGPSIVDCGSATAAAAAETGEATDQESAERCERVTSLSRIWSTTRNQQRHRSLVLLPSSPSSTPHNSKTRK